MARATVGGDIDTAAGEATIGGEPGIEPGIEVDDGGEDIGEETSAHAALLSGKNVPAAVVHELFADVVASLSSSGVEDVIGLGLEEGAFAITESGGRMENILSSAGGGPYESNGSGTACSIGSITGSDLR